MSSKAKSKVISVIAIDGPSGAGKGTIAHRIASQLGWHLLDSGMIYRVLGLASIRQGVDPSLEADLADLAQALDVVFQPDEGGTQVFLEGADVTLELRSEEAGMMASKVAAVPAVRVALMERQRAFVQSPGLVADGRDMGTVVFPDAALKIYLTASVEARAKRRYEQLIAKGLSGNLARLSEGIAARDEADMSRPVAPLKPADDAIVVDSTSMSINQVSDLVLKLILERNLN